MSFSIISIIGAILSVARGSSSGGRQPRAVMSRWKSAVVRAVMVPIGSPLSWERALILSSTSVMLRT
jgi:hypothetical protein